MAKLATKLRVKDKVASFLYFTTFLSVIALTLFIDLSLDHWLIGHGVLTSKRNLNGAGYSTLLALMAVSYFAVNGVIASFIVTLRELRNATRSSGKA